MPEQREALNADIERLLKQNRYDPQSRTLLYTEPEETSYHNQIEMWARHFSDESRNGGLPVKYLTDPQELEQLTAFFA